MNFNEELPNELEGGKPGHAGEASDGHQPPESGADAVESAAHALRNAAIEDFSKAEDQQRKAHDPAPTLTLVPWFSAFEDNSAAPKAKPKTARHFDPLGIAASVAAIGFLVVGAVAGFDHMRQSAMVAGKTEENETLVQSLAALKTRIEAIEAAHSQEQSAELHKTLNEIKAAAATAQGYGASVGQLAQRVDRLEKEQNARFEKLAERIDQSASSRFGEIVARLDKLERKPAAVALAAPPSPAPSPIPVKAQTPPTLLAPPAPQNVSNDITGSIEKPKPVLRGYALEDIRDGMALVDGRDGPYSVSPGDVLPGAGRVLKIERRGRDWVVVTSTGIITTPPEP